MVVKKKNIFTICNILEWTSYSLYGGFAAIIAQKFFPSEHEHLSMIYTYMIFFLGFLSRPIGGVIFGHIADKYGREQSLMYSIILMTGATTIMGLLPEYESFGFLTIILLVLSRFAQGLAIGGEYTGVMVHLVEQSPDNKRGFNGSFADLGCLVGTLLGGQFTVVILQYCLEKNFYQTWGWRIPFLMNGLMIFLWLYMRKYQIPQTQNSSDKTNCQVDDDYIPLIELFKKHKLSCLYVAMSSAFSGLNFYSLLVFIPNYLVASGKLTSIEAFIRTGTVNFLMIPMVLLSGFLSDKITRKGVILPGMIIVILINYPMMINVDNNLGFVLQIIGGLGLSLYFGGRSAFFAEAFPRKLRCTAISISLSISHAIFAGTTPVIATFIESEFGNLSYFSIYVILISFAVLYGFSQIKDRTGGVME